MVTHIFSRTFLSKPTTTKALASLLSRSFSTKSSSPSLSLLCVNRLRHLSSVNVGRFDGVAGPTVRGLATRVATSSLKDNSPNWSNRPPKETILLDGCDFEHWLVVMEKPEGDPTRDDIIDRYIKTLASVVGSDEEARMKIYSVSTKCYFAFGALVDEETSYKLKELPGVRWVLPDSYLNVKNKDYGGEPFINGQAVPYDPKYHEEWIRNNSRTERNRRNDRPRKHDSLRKFERKENMQNRDFQNQGMQNPAPNNLPPSSDVPPNNMGSMSQNMGGMPQNSDYGGTPTANNYGGAQPPPNNYVGAQPPPNYGGAQPPPNNYVGAQPPPNYGGAQPPPNNYGGAQPRPNNYVGAQPRPNNYGGAQPRPNNYGGAQPPPNSYGGAQPPPNNYGGAQPRPNYGGARPPPNNYVGAQPPYYNTGNMGGMPQNAGWSGNTTGNMQQSTDGHAYHNSYPPRQ